MERMIETRSAQETWQAGYEMGQEAVPGQVITLIGDLGVGKTVFTQGFAAGLGVQDSVNSPTFTILQVYEETAKRCWKLAGTSMSQEMASA